MVRDSVNVEDPLNLLNDGNNVYVGRKQSVFDKYKDRSGLYLGKVYEEQTMGRSLLGRPILLDSISPHAIFICGMRGSGKSYTLGVIAEEMATKNSGAGVIIIDPMGIFWSMKNANKIGQEKKKLRVWNLSAKGFKNVNIFMPSGFANEVPSNTYDNEFTIKPSEISVDDWCLTFNIDRFETMGLLIERAFDKVRNGYTDIEGKDVAAMGDEYDISDLIDCIDTEDSINSNSKGFKQTTRRAVEARLNGASEWGIFAKEGTKLNDLSKRGTVTVIDVSFLDDNVRALVVGIIARNLLNTRKKVSRHEATGSLKNVFGSIPVTWLMIDEAHILVPASGQKTAASDSLIEYVRQGRQPGCSLVLATQQPSAIDSRILSQTDILMCHKLVYDDDIKAVTRRMPSEMPAKFKNSHFIKNLPIGMAIIGDKQEQTSRAFLAKIRPRISQHEGRERTSTMDMDKNLLRVNVKELVEDCFNEDKMDGVPSTIASIEKEYGIKIDLDSILSELANEGKIAGDGIIRGGTEELPKATQEDTDDVVVTDLPALEGPQEPQEGPSAFLETEFEGKDDMPLDIPIDGFKPVEAYVSESMPPSLLDILPVDDPAGEEKRIDYSRVSVIFEKVTIDDIPNIAEKKLKKRFFSSNEQLACHYLVYYPLWQITYDYFPRRKKYASMATYVDGITGELVLKERKRTRTRGMRELLGLKRKERDFLLYLIERENATYTDINNDLEIPEKKARALVEALLEQRLVVTKKRGNNLEIHINFDFNLVKSPVDKKVARVELEYGKELVDKESLIDFVITESNAKKVIEFFEHIQIWDAEKVYYPYWVAVYEGEKSKRIEVFDGVTGRADDDTKEMLRYRI